MDGQEGSLIWGQRYSRESSDIFSLETDIARQVAEGLRLQLSDEEGERLAETGTKNPEAYRAHLKGMYHHVRTELNEAIFWNQQAIAMDPDYQEACLALGWNHFAIASRKASQEDYSKARASWEKVVEIDDSAALAHWCKAWILFSYEKDWKGTEREFIRAKEVDPSFESAAKLWFYEAFVDWMGRRGERLALIARALKRADPLSAGQQIMPGYAFLWNREYDRAIEQAKHALALKPELVGVAADAYHILAGCYDRKGMSEEAFASTLEAARLAGRSDEEMAALEKAFEEEGMQGVRRWHLDRRLKEGDARLVRIAILYAELGDRDKAFEWLEKAWEQPLWGYKNAPSSCTWDTLRDDPRFEKLLRKLNLPEDAIARHLTVPRETP